jgi:two-component system, NarL family, invasion response regulator UvrY
MGVTKKQIKIALVDDHNLFRKCLSNFIKSEEQNKYFVLFDAENGNDLIAQLDKHRLPDIVVMDINMPGMDGFETVEWLQKNFPSIQILIVSMIEKEETIVKMLRLGVKGYLSKDIDPEGLYKALDEVSKGEYHYTKFLTGKLIHSVLKSASISEQGGLGSDKITNKWNTLSQREKEFVQLACTEMTYQEIAGKMFLAPKTIEGYRESVFEKLDLKNRIGLVLFVIKNELVKIQ